MEELKLGLHRKEMWSKKLKYRKIRTVGFDEL